jgi:prevent-host-death family protein
MNSSVGIRELRQQTSVVLKRVMAGEIIEVTEHGHPIAHIVPLRSGILEQMIVEGRIIPAKHDLLDSLDALSLPAPPEGSMLPSHALEELRSSED